MNACPCMIYIMFSSFAGCLFIFYFNVFKLGGRVLLSIFGFSLSLFGWSSIFVANLCVPSFVVQALSSSFDPEPCFLTALNGFKLVCGEACFCVSLVSHGGFFCFFATGCATGRRSVVDLATPV